MTSRDENPARLLVKMNARIRAHCRSCADCQSDYHCSVYEQMKNIERLPVKTRQQLRAFILCCRRPSRYEF